MEISEKKREDILERSEHCEEDKGAGVRGGPKNKMERCWRAKVLGKEGGGEYFEKTILLNENN